MNEFEIPKEIFLMGIFCHIGFVKEWMIRVKIRGF